MADQGYPTRRGARTVLLTRCGVQTPVPAPGRLTSALRRAVGRLETPDRTAKRRPLRSGGVASDHNATVLYVITGLFGGAYETWTSTRSPLDPPPSGHAVTDRTYTVTNL